MKAALAFCGSAALAALAPVAWACGVCVEDKMAATYDYEVVQRASATGKVMVFCEVGGQLDAGRIRTAARQVRGLDAASLRISSQPAALSFALDSARQSPQSAVLAIQHAAPAGTRITILRLIAAPPAAVKASGR